MSFKSIANKITHYFLIRILIGIIMVGVAIASSNLISRFALDMLVTDKETRNVVAGIFTAGLALASYVLFVRLLEKRSATELRLDTFWSNALLGFVVGFALQSLVILTIYVFAEYSVDHINPVTFLLPGFTIALTSAVAEEIILRGIIFRIIQEKLGSVIALLFSAALFGLLHIGNPGATVLSSISIAIQAGLLLAAAYLYSGSLWLPIFLHFAWNFSEAGIYGAVISGNTVTKKLLDSHIAGNPLITGGQFGPENSIQATLFCLIVVPIFLYGAHKHKQFVRPFWRR